MNATLTHSFKYLICYFIIHTAIFTAHSALLHLLLGQSMREYSSFGLAQFEMFKLLLASTDLDANEMMNNSIFLIVFYSFYIFVYVVLAGIFLAIINDGYLFVMANYDSSPELEYSVFWRSMKSSANVKFSADNNKKFDLDNLNNKKEDSISQK